MEQINTHENRYLPVTHTVLGNLASLDKTICFIQIIFLDKYSFALFYHLFGLNNVFCKTTQKGVLNNYRQVKKLMKSKIATLTLFFLYDTIDQ